MISLVRMTAMLVILPSLLSVLCGVFMFFVIMASGNEQVSIKSLYAAGYLSVCGLLGVAVGILLVAATLFADRGER